MAPLGIETPHKVQALQRTLWRKAKAKCRTVHGKPDAGNPPVRFDEGWGTQCCSQHPRPLPTLPLAI